MKYHTPAVREEAESSNNTNQRDNTLMVIPSNISSTKKKSVEFNMSELRSVRKLIEKLNKQ